MPKVRVHMMMAIDGYVAGPNQTLEKPFGDRMEHFGDWYIKLKTFQELMGNSGGDTGPSDDVIRETMAGLGAWVLGRNMFGGGHGPWSPDWKGWWGSNPPYHTPVYVVTHHPREPLKMEGGTEFFFVTDGIESALRQAQAAAGDKDVRIGGGASVVNQYLAAGLVDEIELHVVPSVIGAGERLFEGLGDNRPELELIRSIQGADATHLKYRVLK